MCGIICTFKSTTHTPLFFYPKRLITASALNLSESFPNTELERWQSITHIYVHKLFHNAGAWKISFPHLAKFFYLIYSPSNQTWSVIGVSSIQPLKIYYTVESGSITRSGTKQHHSKIVTIVQTILDTPDNKRNQLIKNLSSEDLKNIKNLYDNRFSKWKLPELVKNLLRYLTRVQNDDTFQALIQEKQPNNSDVYTPAAPVEPIAQPTLTNENLALPPALGEVVNNSSKDVGTHYNSYLRNHTQAASENQLVNCKVSIELLYSKIINHEIDELHQLSSHLLTATEMLKIIQQRLADSKRNCELMLQTDIGQLPNNQQRLIEGLKSIQQQRQQLKLQIEFIKKAQHRQNNNSNPSEKNTLNQLQITIVNADLNTLAQNNNAINGLLEKSTLITQEEVASIFPPTPSL